MSKPLFCPEDRTKYIFRIDEITENFKCSADDRRSAEKFVREGRVEITGADLFRSSSSSNVINFGVKITDYNDTEHEVKICASEKRFLNIYCYPRHEGHRPGDEYSDWRSLCRYEMAAFITLNDYIEKYNPGDTSDDSAISLLRAFRGADSCDDSEKPRRKDVLLEMNLDMNSHIGRSRYRNGNLMRASLKIGNGGKMYVLKSIADLENAYRCSETMTLGKNAVIDFSVSDFTDESKAILDTLNRWKREERVLNRKFSDMYFHNDMSNVQKNSVVIDETNMDDFFEMTNSQVKIQGFPVEKREEPLKFTMELAPSYCGNLNEFEGINAEIKLPGLIKGKNSYYTVTLEKKSKYILQRLPAEQNLILDSLGIKEPGNAETRKMHIGGKRVNEFVRDTLPKLEKYVKIKSSELEKISEYLPPLPEFHFYMDAADGIPACYPRVVYGQTEYDFTDHLKNLGIAGNGRDTQKEAKVLKTALKYFYVEDPEHGRVYCEPDDTEAVFTMITDGLDELSEFGTIHATDSFDSIRVRNNFSFSVGVSIENDILNLELTSDDFTPEELLELVKSYQKKKKFHLLKNGSFIPLDDRIRELSLMMEAMNISAKEFTKGKMQIPAYRALYLDRMLDECHELYSDRDSHYKQLIRNFRTVNDSDFEVPECLSSVMRGYQKYGHRWLRTLETYRFGGILADDMGLGKTLQVISVLLTLKNEGNEVPSLIVCPASLVFNWYEEFRKFAPEMKILTITGTAAERKNLISSVSEYDAAVTSYDLLKRDIAEYENTEFMYQIIDEAQYIKTHTTAAAKSVKLIRSKFRFALTGTPIENRLSELWSIFDYLMPNFLYGYEKFRKEIEIPVVKYNDEDAATRLRRLVSPFILRRLKTDVLKDLPEKIEETQYAKFEPEQQKLYDAQVVTLQKMLSDEDEGEFRKNKIQIFAELTKIRQICCDPSLVYENYKGYSAKREACTELVKSAIDGGHRMLIFSQFTSMLDIVASDLKEEGIDFFTITGSTPKEERTELVREFNNGNVPVFLISLKAGGTGLNLTGADVVIHLDPWWNVAAQNQATDRAHRIGQKRTVTVYKLIIKNTIEEKIQQMQEKKKALADSILNSDSSNISSLTREELLSLFD